MRRGVGTTAVALITAMLAYALVAVPDAPVAAAAVAAPATSNPEAYNAPPCDPRVELGCGLASPSLINSRIPIEEGDADGVNALQANAEALVLDQHDWDANDPRVYQWGQPDIWGTMWASLLGIIRKSPSDRTPEENGAYHWFQQVVQQYKIQATEKAQAEYDNWKSQQCSYKPSAPTPAYSVGGGCTGSVTSLFTGARVPSFEDLQAWGAYAAGQKLGASASSLEAIGAGLQAGLLATGAAVGTALGIFYVSTVSSAVGAAMVGSAADISALSTVAGSAFAGAGISAAIVVIALVLIIVAIVALIVSIVQQAQYAEIPDKLKGAINEAKNNLPDLHSMTNDTTTSGGNLLFALFVGQTLVRRPWPAPFVFATPKPSWRGDLLQSQSFDTSVNPPTASGGVVSSRALSVKSWGDPWDAITKAPQVNGGPPPVIWLTDRGWFQQSIDNGASWTTNSSLRYLDWTGKKRTALIRGDHFIDVTSDGGSTANPSAKLCDANKCSYTQTLELLDANGTPVSVSMNPALAVPAVITHNGHLSQGDTTTFTDPHTNSLGGPVTYKWEIEAPCAVGTLCFQPTSLGGFTDPAWHGNPVREYTGQTVSHTWSATGTFHVRLTTTNNIGTRVSDRDLFVSRANTPPTITYKRVELGPLYDDGTAHVTGCLGTLPGKGLRPSMTIDWGDGTTPQTAQPLLYAQFLDFNQAPPPEPAFQVVDGGVHGCSTAWSFSAHHKYETPTANGYEVRVSANDGDGRTVVSLAGVAEFVDPDFAPTFFGFTNNFGATHEGMPLYDEGKSANLRVTFPVPPDHYGQRFEIDWDDGIHSTVLRSCPIGQTTDCFDTSYDFPHTFWSAPGTTGYTIRTVTLTMRNSDGSINRQITTPVAIKNIAPTIKTMTITPAPHPQGSEVTVSGTIGLADGDTPLAIKFAWTDSTGTTKEALNIGPVNGDRGFEAKHIVREDGTRFDVSITDNAGGTKTGFAIIGVSNVPPDPTLDPVAVDQGTPLQLSVVTGDPGTDKFTQTVDWGDGTTAVQPNSAATNGVLLTPAHTYDVPGEYPVSVTLNDGHGGEAAVTSSVKVENVRPAVVVPDVAGVNGTPVTLNGTITDPGSQDSFTGTVDWRDGTAPQSFSRPAGATTFALTHTYQDGGLYPVIVNVTDNRGGASDDATGTVSVNGPPDFTANDPSDAVVGQPVGYQFSARGFPLPTYTLAEGTLPPGLTLRDDGWLYGTPTTAGSYPFRVKAENQFGSQTSPVTTLDVLQAPAFTAESPPDAIVGRSYSYTFAASGVPAPTFRLASGDLPPGLTLSGTGVLSGTPTTVGSSTFEVEAKNPGGTATSSQTLEVVATPALSAGNESTTEGASGVSTVVQVPVSLAAPSPVPVTVRYATVDRSATAGSDYVAVSGRLSFAPGDVTKNVPVTVLGDAGNEADETFDVRLSSPTVATITDGLGTVTITNDDPLPTVGVGDARLLEGPADTKSTMGFPVRLSAPSGRTIKVSYLTRNGSARASTDYVATSGTLTFAPGTTSQTIPVKVIGDGLDEIDETFVVELRDLVAVGAGDLSGTGTIADDDAPPKLTIADSAVAEGKSGTQTKLTFKLTLSKPSGKSVAVSYGTADNSALAGQDYLAASGTVTFSAGETTKTISVTVLGDGTVESNEKFALWINTADAVLSRASAVGTIKNDD